MKAKLAFLAVGLIFIGTFGCAKRNKETIVKSETGQVQEMKPVEQPAPEVWVDPRPEPFVKFDVAPAPFEAPYPDYPTKAKKEGREGRVIVQVLLDLDGSVMRTRVVQSSGQLDLDEAATEGAKKFKFMPAMRHKKPVRVWVNIPIEFRLQR